MSAEARARGWALLALLIGVVVALCRPAYAEAGEELAIELTVGEQRVISTERVRSFSEGVKGIVDVRLTRDASQFVIVALRPGQTTLLLLLTDGTERHYVIRVADPAPGAAAGPLEVQAKDNVRLDFYFVQLDKSYNHQLGLAWPGSVGGTASAVFNLQTGQLESATAVVANQPLPRLDMAQAAGWAKLMRQAAVVTANGEKARFAGGGEVNIPVTGSLSTGIHQISFGSSIEVLPRYDADSGRIELQLQADVSDLTADRGGAPGRTTSSLQTVVNLELGQSLVLAGLTARSEASSQSGLPLLSQIPILGALFGSNAVNRQDTENIVIIVPTVADASSVRDRRRIQAALRAYQQFSGKHAPVLLPEPKVEPRRGRRRQ